MAKAVAALAACLAREGSCWDWCCSAIAAYELLELDGCVFFFGVEGREGRWVWFIYEEEGGTCALARDLCRTCGELHGGRGTSGVCFRGARGRARATERRRAGACEAHYSTYSLEFMVCDSRAPAQELERRK